MLELIRRLPSSQINGADPTTHDFFVLLITFWTNLSKKIRISCMAVLQVAQMSVFQVAHILNKAAQMDQVLFSQTTKMSSDIAQSI